jgi:photosystem II stability/assembly factor-like uncharacterized protein
MLALGLGATATALVHPGWAAAPYPALDRPALSVREPQRSVLLAVTQAGSRIVAVGERGIVALSDDQGVRWRQAAAVPASVTLTAVRFVDASHGWAVGHGGIILHTTDGGEHWKRQADARTLTQSVLREAGANGSPGQRRAAQQLVDDGPDKPLLDLHGFDRQRVMVVGAANLCFETRDGGHTWHSAVHRIHNPGGMHLYAIRADGPSLFIVGEQGLMLRSRDAGQTFERLQTPYDGSWFTLEVPRPGMVVAAGLRGNVFVSSDQGGRWSQLTGAPAASIVGSTVLADRTLFLVTQSGQLLTLQSPISQDRSVRVIDGPPLAPLAGLLPTSDGALITVGAAGVVRIPAPARADTESLPSGKLQ